MVEGKTKRPREGKGKALYDARKARGLTQQQLADLAGLSRTAVNHIERGRRTKSYAETIHKLELVLKTEISPRIAPSQEAAAKAVSEVLGVMIGAKAIPSERAIASRERFLKSPLGKSMKLTDEEKSELATFVWFDPSRENPDDEAWYTFVSARRKLKRRDIDDK